MYFPVLPLFLQKNTSELGKIPFYKKDHKKYFLS